jgi:hypothetical protein
MLNNRALRLNGSSRVEVLLGDSASALTQFTIYAEFLPDISSSMCVLSRAIFNTIPNQKQSFNLLMNYGGGGLRYRMKKAGNCDNTNTNTAYGTEVLGLGTPAIKTWNYGAITYDGGTIKMYMNGVLVGTGNEPGATLCSGAPLMIGSWVQASPLYFKGEIDELRIYNRAFTATEITNLNRLRK